MLEVTCFWNGLALLERQDFSFHLIIIVTFVTTKYLQAQPRPSTLPRASVPLQRLIALRSRLEHKQRGHQVRLQLSWNSVRGQGKSSSADGGTEPRLLRTTVVFDSICKAGKAPRNIALNYNTVYYIPQAPFVCVCARVCGFDVAYKSMCRLARSAPFLPLLLLLPQR